MFVEIRTSTRTLQIMCPSTQTKAVVVRVKLQ
jgi:hypothetical protein